MNSIVQMVLLTALLSIALVLVLTSSEAISEAKASYNKAVLNKARALLENRLAQLSRCGEGCYVDVELPVNVSLYLENNSCLLFDEYGNAESCYFPFTTPPAEINSSSFRLWMRNTVLEVEALG